MEWLDILFDQLAKKIHGFSLMIAENVIHDLEGDEERRKEAKFEVCDDCGGSLLKDSMSNELHDPGKKIYHTHEPEVRLTEVVIFLILKVIGVAKYNCGTPPA